MLPKDFNIFSFAQRITRPLILDGAMGSMLQQGGADTSSPLWSSLANIQNREIVLKTHLSYIEAGADIITTNTFRTNPYALQNSSLRINQKQFVKSSVDIALEAKKNLPILIAGSNAPAEDCYQIERNITYKELEVNHSKHIELLWDSGCDFILNETQSHIDEIRIICEFCSKNGIPFVLSLFFDKDLKLLSGEPLMEVIEIIKSYNPLSIGFNCIKPETFEKAKPIIGNINWGVYLNCGSGVYTDENILCGINEQQYFNLIKHLLPLKPSFVGACCGSTPKHIKQIWNLLNGIS